MKNPSKKQDAEGNWYGRAASNVRSFRHYAWFDWAAIGSRARPPLGGPRAAGRDQVQPVHSLSDAPHSKHALAPLRSSRPLWRSDRRFVVGADAILVMQRCAKGHSPVQLQGGGEGEDLHPAPAALDVYLRGRARYSLQPGYSARPRVAGEARRAAGLESDRRAPVDDVPRRQVASGTSSASRSPPSRSSAARSRRARSKGPRAPAAEGQEDEAQGRGGAVGPAERGVPGLARPPLRGVWPARFHFVLKNVTQKPPPPHDRSAENTTRDARRLPLRGRRRRRGRLLDLLGHGHRR